MREGARAPLSLSRSLASLAASLVLSLASAAVRRNGESGVAIWLERAGLNRSGVTVWAWARVAPEALSARHGNSARKIAARLTRPLAGPRPTMQILQQIHILVRRVPSGRGKRR